MKRIRVFLLMLTVLLLFLCPYCGTAQHPVSRPRLIAVLVVGPLEDTTDNSIEKMNDLADFLEKNNVTVRKFYNKDAKWSEIVKASQGAHIFVYSGHGTDQGFNGNAGGLGLTSVVSSNEIAVQLKIHSNALVLFQSVCSAAGSSAGDEGDIGVKEALDRVSQYPRPFFYAGAGCYFANNLGGGCLSFLKLFFKGENVKTCFQETTKLWSHIETIQTYTFDHSKEIGIASTQSTGESTRTTYINGMKKVKKIPSAKNYDIAFVSEPGFTIDRLTK